MSRRRALSLFRFVLPAVLCNRFRYSSVRWVTLVVLLISFCSFHPHAAWNRSGTTRLPAPQSPERLFSPAAYLQVGEELLYRVSYLFIGLGEIRLRVTDRYHKDGETRYRAEVYIDSYSGNPFVNLHQVYESEFDTMLYSHHFVGRWQDGDIWRYVKYDFRYDRDKIFIETGRYDLQTVEKHDTVDINRRYQEGLSLFYFARGYVKSGQAAVIPTFINGNKAKTYFDFTDKTTDKEIDSITYPIDVIEFEGEADWVGIFGLTGGFRGWFSNDEARVPIVAKMKVIIGSVKVTLQSWKRSGWRPTQYIEKD